LTSSSQDWAFCITKTLRISPVGRREKNRREEGREWGNRWRVVETRESFILSTLVDWWWAGGQSEIAIGGIRRSRGDKSGGRGGGGGLQKHRALGKGFKPLSTRGVLLTRGSGGGNDTTKKGEREKTGIVTSTFISFSFRNSSFVNGGE